MFEKKKFKIPLDEFMQNALYHPKKGYYMKKIPFGINEILLLHPIYQIYFLK